MFNKGTDSVTVEAKIYGTTTTTWWLGRKTPSPQKINVFVLNVLNGCNFCTCGRMVCSLTKMKFIVAAAVGLFCERLFLIVADWYFTHLPRYKKKFPVASVRHKKYKIFLLFLPLQMPLLKKSATQFLHLFFCHFYPGSGIRVPTNFF